MPVDFATCGLCGKARHMGYCYVPSIEQEVNTSGARLLSVDPGKDHVAVSFFTSGTYLWTRVYLDLKPHELRARILDDGQPDHVVVEMPHATRGRDADPNDLLTLAVVCGVCMSIGPSSFMTPHQWKGTQSKKVSHDKIRDILNVQERARLDEACKYIKNKYRGDALDSLGIGLSLLRRT